MLAFELSWINVFLRRIVSNSHWGSIWPGFVGESSGVRKSPNLGLASLNRGSLEESTGLMAALVVAAPAPALAINWADGDKDWDVQAVEAFLATPSSSSSGNKLAFDLYIQLVSGYYVSCGLITFQNAWGGSSKELYWEQSLPGITQRNQIWWWNIGANGELHKYTIIRQKSYPGKFVFYWDGSEFGQSVTTDPYQSVASWAGVYGDPTSYGSSFTKTQWSRFAWAKHSDWVWRYGWPSPTYIYDVPNDQVHATYPPSDNDYTEIW